MGLVLNKLKVNTISMMS